ncbi:MULTISPECIES: hypothetical protein [Methylobacterium]|jgi:hypothetical protein|uniref:Transposase n=1 Tax=Methylobacterium longum TaxID=767694 RepID=A0ABT8AZF1_9HYPH|nr:MULTISPECIES: hypothetical protein [Methylobacterium]MCJ2100554.1 hypothetical protein [Methylobacterium sp. E-046]MDN3574801.1 hypothetical protein [Methylobacterium longum]GJE11144.1 hypothetical protein FOHLNKBM_2185 [Methylobacterium longum]
MIVIKPQEPCSAPSSDRASDPLHEVNSAATAALIPFPGTEARRTRRIVRSGEQRGEILLFLGVRYERLAS